MKKIHILESTLRYLIDEGRNAEKAKQKTIAVMRSYLSQYGVQGEQLETMAMEYENSFKEWLFHANMPDSVIRLEPIMANVAMQIGFTLENRNTRELYRLKDITSYIIENYDKENFPIALNKLTLKNTTFDSLNELFGDAVDSASGSNNSSRKKKVKCHYTVKRLDTFQEAHKYHKYTQNICYLDSWRLWKQYTDEGKNAVYALLRDGWEDVPAEHGEDTPYDDYGESMVFVIIRPDGDVAYTNTRWNHNTNGQGPRDVDQSFRDRMGEISDMLQTDYRNILKPYKRVSIQDFRKLIQDSNDVLAKCYHVGRIGRHLYQCYLNHNDSVLFNDETREITPENDILLSDVYEIENGYMMRNTSGEVALTDKNGHQLSDWYCYIFPFNDGVAVVQNDDRRYSVINSQGKQLCRWFDFVGNFCDGFAGVQEGRRRWSFINREGQQICDWYALVKPFREGFAIVMNDEGKYSFINTQGKRICGWYDRVYNFVAGYGGVLINNKHYLIDGDGNIFDMDTMKPLQQETKIRLNNLISETLRQSMKNYLLHK